MVGGPDEFDRALVMTNKPIAELPYCPYMKETEDDEYYCLFSEDPDSDEYCDCVLNGEAIEPP